MKQLSLLLALLFFANTARADWHLQWVQQLPERKPAWEYTARMPVDRAYEPVAAGNLVLVGCEYNGALLAFDARTGKQQWSYYTNGPIRFAPVADSEQIYVVSDDGYLHCLNHQGELQWKIRGGPSDRQVVGHERMMSAWPGSAQPILKDGKVYFVAGYWPVEGIFVYAVDGETGKQIWNNSSAQFRPFGKLRIIDNTLFIDGHHGNGAFDISNGQLLKIKPPKRSGNPPPSVPSGVKGSVAGRYLSGNYLLISTREGSLYTFAKEKGEVQKHLRSVKKDKDDGNRAQQILQATGIRDGYCLVAGLTEGSLVAGLLRHSKLHVIACDANRELVNKVRHRLEEQGLFDDHRLQVLAGDFRGELPPYFASLIVSEKEGDLAKEWVRSLRPFGGTLVVQRGEKLKITKREGPLPGSANWTHETADSANSLVSQDSLVKAPLGLLWYGGEAAAPRFYFDGHVDHQSGHGINPQPAGAQIVDGRMFLQGPGLMGAVDIYTGRILWETSLPKIYVFGGSGGGLGIHSRKHPHPWKYPPALKMDVKPTQHSRASGFNYVSVADGIYIGAGEDLLRLNPVDGKMVSSWKVPLPEKGLCWGRMRVVGDLLISTVLRPRDLEAAEAGWDGQGGDWASDRMPMSHLVVVNRETGKLVWQQEAKWGFLNRGLAVGNGKVFGLDLVVKSSLSKWKANGRKLPKTPPMLHAWDLKTGKEVWSFPLDVYVRYLSYSEKRDLLLVPCRNLMIWKDGDWYDLSFDIKRGKRNKRAPGKMRGFRGNDGKIVWEVDTEPYFDPHIILGDLVIDRYGYTYDLLTGERAKRKSPLTGLLEEWNFRKSGCNYLIACENMITWRTALYDLASGSGVMKLHGFDAGCTPTLLPAGGLLNIPNFGTHHKRNRMTAMALVHLPENDLWTEYSLTKPEKPAPFVRVGFNLGAPGDRQDDEGTLWLRMGPRKNPGVIVQGKELQWFEIHPSKVDSWVARSGVRGATRVQLPTLYSSKRGFDSDGKKHRFTVRLYFAEPEDLRPKQRVFHVSLNGKQVLTNLDLARETEGTNTSVIREFKGVEVEGMLDIALTPVSGETVLCGVELIAE